MGIEDSSQLPWTTKGKYYLVLLYYIAKRTLSKFFICSLSELKSSLVMDQVLPGLLIIRCATKHHPKNVCLGQKNEEKTNHFSMTLKKPKARFGVFMWSISRHSACLSCYWQLTYSMMRVHIIWQDLICLPSSEQCEDSILLFCFVVKCTMKKK